MRPQVRTFYTFLGLHSFLIGLFPFYIPVFLFKRGFSLSEISAFIGVSGIGFCLTLYFWDRLLKKHTLLYVICLSFILEILLMTTFFLEQKYLFLLLCGGFNGAYNCSFWILQRLLFLEISTPQNSGNRFGNLQIVAFTFLKVAIFTGGFVLDTLGYPVLYVLAVLMAVMSIFYFQRMQTVSSLQIKLSISSPISLRQLSQFRDTFNSRTIFAVDGVFLFLEAYFWVISMFTMVQESFWKLGMLVVVLAVLFSGLFFIIKRRIDRIAGQKIYVAAVLLYGCSWFLRGICNDELGLAILIVLLACITFFTSFFRLAFNKRFFDLAKSTGKPYAYVLVKSYYSQFFLALFFGLLAFLPAQGTFTTGSLPYIYCLAGISTVVYLFYKKDKERELTPP